jgi:hypothetical protein
MIFTATLNPVNSDIVIVINGFYKYFRLFCLGLEILWVIIPFINSL